MGSGIIKSKKGAEDGHVDHSDGTIQEDNRGPLYSFKGQTLSASLGVNSAVTFETSQDAAGETLAVNIQPV